MPTTINETNVLYPVFNAITEMENRIRVLDEQLRKQTERSESLENIRVLHDQQIKELVEQIKPSWEVTADQILAAAKVLDKVAVPYAFGGDNMLEGGLDCSGFVKVIFETVLGIKLPRSSKDQATIGVSVLPKDVRKGDVLFYDYGVDRPGIDHTGIYMGDGHMIHTNTPAAGINIKAVTWSTVVAIRRYF